MDRARELTYPRRRGTIRLAHARPVELNVAARAKGKEMPAAFAGPTMVGVALRWTPGAG